MSDKYRITVQDSITTLTIDDGKANVIHSAFLDGLTAAMDRTLAENAGALVIAGRPGYYSAGIDLKTLPALPPPDRDVFMRQFGEVMIRLFTFERPVIAAITGHAIAGGAVLALCADKRVAAEGAFKIGLNEVAISLPLPTYVVDFALAALPTTSLVDAVMHGKLYDPQAAKAIGYVDVVTSADNCVAEATNIARSVVGLPTMAYKLTKERLRGRMVAYGHSQILPEMNAFTSALGFK